MKRIILLMSLAFAVLAGPVAVALFPTAAVADPCSGSDCGHGK